MTVINLTSEVALKLETITAQMKGKEFSGIGFVNFADGNFTVYDIVLISVGSEAYTEIPSAKILQLMARQDAACMKLWFHRHGLGNGNPGKHCWSGVDDHTAREEPLGCPIGMAHLTKWSISIVRTPCGWVGRYDTYGKGGKTTHLRVTPSLAQTITPELDVLWTAYALEHDYARKHNATTTYRDIPVSRLAQLYEGVEGMDFDPRENEEDEQDVELLEQISQEVDGMTFNEATDYISDVYGIDDPYPLLDRLGIKRQSTFLGRLFHNEPL